MMAHLSRRGFIGAGSATAALVLGWRDDAVFAASPGAQARLNDWLAIGSDGAVTVRVNCVEMGQGAQTGFAQIVADELEADWRHVSVEMAPITQPYLTRRGQYMTGGSGSIEFHMGRLRQMGAAGRDMLVRAAATRWGVEPGACHAELGRVIQTATGKSLDYGVLAGAAAALSPPSAPSLKPRETWRYIGQPVPRLDLPTKVDGSAVYGLDVERPGMLVATLAQSPRFGGKLASVDEGPALAVPGVRRVVKLDAAVAVIAVGYWAAKTGLESLKPAWTDGPLAGVSSADVSTRLRALAQAGGQTPRLTRGQDAATAKAANDAALRGAPRRFSQTYEVPLLSHSPLEPMNATALVGDGRAELWAPTQVQSSLRRQVANALGIDPANVEIHTTQIGGGFGRRLQTDYGVLAALVARGQGAPVKLIWGRAEDTQHGFYRPATVATLEAGLDSAGMPVAFKADIACLDDDPFGGIAPTPYALANTFVAASTWNPGIPIGAWRSVDWTQNTFFVESFIDELAHLTKIDPVAYRERLLQDNPRMLRLLRAVADRAGWGHAPPIGRFRGVALCERGGTCCVEVVEISPRSAGEAPVVHKVTAGIDCGTAVNPGQIRAQVEGGIIMALSAALAQEITLEDGRVEQAYFDTYPMVHLRDAPAIDTLILESPTARITGAGEAPVPPLAPALCNALATATGERVRTLPIVSQKRRGPKASRT